jgi:tetratricopeptide (TPR) repeat protein/DNA-binding XRE family transcriptional regulator
VVEPPVQFASVLRRLRTETGLTQDELAESAGLSSRAVSDLERGMVATPRKDTVRLLADALGLDGMPRLEFEAVARGRALVGGVTASHRTLPRDILSFTGRGPELQALQEVARNCRDSSEVVAIHAIGGMAGVGKTAFAVHAAHRLADRFASGQIFLPLHGHTPGHQPVDPADALGSLLLVIGVPTAQIPAGLEARAGLWRDRVARRKVLIVLDDAANSEQVRPLLPGLGGSLVLVTSRRRLSALEDATTIRLDALPPDDAAALLVRLAARPELSPDDDAVREMARLAGYLPLAIGMLARQLHHHPAWTVARRAAELAATLNRLDLLATEDVSVAAAFDLSYEDLTLEQQRLFRRLGLHPAGEVDAFAAAALDNTDLSAARHGLEALYDQHLLTEPSAGRYRMHDLLRHHARDLAGLLDSAHDRDQAVAGVLDYYRNAAARAQALLARQAHAALVPAVRPTRAVIPVLTNREEALAWARAEHASLLACLDYVTATGEHAHVVALTAGITELLRIDGPWTDAISRHGAALRAARHLDDRPGQAGALGSRGRVRQLTGDYPGAVRDLQDALDVYRDLGDQPGQASALTNLADVRWLAGDFPAAGRDLEEALGMYRDVGDRPGLAAALGSRGRVRQLTGDYPGAAGDLQEALSIYRDLGDRRGQADTLLFLGTVRRATGDHPAAARDLQEALDVYRDLGHRLGQANALNFLGNVRRLKGDHPGAARDLQVALDIYRDVGDRGGEATALNETGALCKDRGDVCQARSSYQQALNLAREIGSTWDEAHALAGLGRCALASGSLVEAEGSLVEALKIFQKIGAAEVADVSDDLRALRGAVGTASASASDS